MAAAIRLRGPSVGERPIQNKSSPRFDAITEVFCDDVELHARHNSGLYGVVWKGRQRGIQREVAVKIIRPEFVNVADAIIHARALAKVNHKNVVTVYQVARLRHPETGEIVDAVVMEWCDGEQLGTRLSGKRFALADAIGICRGLLSGLEAIHAQGIVHGDLHPGNILLTSIGAKIIDIHYADAQSLNHLTTASRESRIAGDVNSACYLIKSIVSYSDAALPLLAQLEGRLLDASSLAELTEIVIAADLCD
jgi:serine/threonine protein kinase